ncbi:MAG: hypothetical protein V4577_22380 [Bacteroidota bacterium]
MELQIPLNKLSDSEHNSLLERINGLPFGDGQAGIYKKSLEELFTRYNRQLNDLANTIATYEEISLLIRQRQPLMNIRQYARVRRIEQLNGV